MGWWQWGHGGAVVVLVVAMGPLGCRGGNGDVVVEVVAYGAIGVLWWSWGWHMRPWWLGWWQWGRGGRGGGIWGHGGAVVVGVFP